MQTRWWCHCSILPSKCYTKPQHRRWMSLSLKSFRCIFALADRSMSILLLHPHHFPLLRGVDVSYEMPPFNSVLRFLPDNSLSEKSFLVLSNDFRFCFPLLLSVVPPSPSCPHIIFHFSTLHIPLQPTFLHFLSLHLSLTFVVPLIISSPLILSSLVTPLIHLNILIFATSNLMPANGCSPKTVER